MTELVAVTRWARLLPFNFRSHLQVKAYLRAKGYPIPRHRTDRDPATGERRETTNEESLAELMREGRPAAGDPVLEAVLDGRHLAKAVDYLSDTYLHPDGRLHPIYTMRPKQRLSSAAPNVMNFPKGKRGEVIAEAAGWILRSILADEGYTLVSADWNSLHPTLIAFFANDPDYARIARMGDHAYILSHYLTAVGKLPGPVLLDRPDAAVKADLDTLKERYPREYQIVKVANLAYKYMQGLENMARTIGLSWENARLVRRAIDDAMPKVTAWKWRTMLQAHSEGRLVSPFGLPLCFFDVFKARGGKVLTSKKESNVVFPDGLPLLGIEAYEVVSFMPLATESGMLREVLVTCYEHPECELRYAPFTNEPVPAGVTPSFSMLMPEHDKVIFQIKDSEVDRITKEVVLPVMGRAWPELNGLRVGVDVETGKALGRAEKWAGLKGSGD